MAEVLWHWYRLVASWYTHLGVQVGWQGYCQRKLCAALGLVCAVGPRSCFRPGRFVFGCSLCVGVLRFGSALVSAAG